MYNVTCGSNRKKSTRQETKKVKEAVRENKTMRVGKKETIRTIENTKASSQQGRRHGQLGRESVVKSLYIVCILNIYIYPVDPSISF